MGLDTSTLAQPIELCDGSGFEAHPFYERNNLLQIDAGKQQMHDAVEELVLSNVPGDTTLRFMSLPGKFWRFENRLKMAYKKRFEGNSFFTGFERDPYVILGGGGYVPRELTATSRIKGFRAIESLSTEYFKTNGARWLSMDVNAGLTLNNGLFRSNLLPRGEMKRMNVSSAMEWWLRKFCGWDAVWLDYFGPISQKIGEALTNLHWHCRPSLDVIPVAVSVLKGREFDDVSISDRREWLSARLSANGLVEFQTQEYFEYTDGGSTMCNILGKICRTKER